MSPILFILILASLPPLDDGLTYTAMSRLQDLAMIEKTLIQSLDDYIETEKSTLKQVEKLADQVRRAHEKRDGNNTEENYWSPIEVYSLLKRFVYHWSKLASLLQGNSSRDLLSKLDIHKPYFPTVEGDLYGAISAIFLLQDTYNITAKQMASGQIPGTNVKVEVPADDCYELGSFALYFGRYHRARGWLTEALERSKRPNYDRITNMSAVLEHASWVEYTTGNLERALKLGIELIKINPNHTRMLDNIMRYRLELKAGPVKRYEHIKADEDKKLTEAYAKTTLNRLCREEPLRKYRRQSRFLKCRYINTHPLLVLKPGKEEVVLASPIKIVIFRDFLRGYDLEKIKDVARPYLKRSEAFNLKTGKLEVVPYRISESTWVHESATVAVKRLNQRAEAVTGLDVSTAEDLQVANYGLGGQYEEHHDHGYPGSPLVNHHNGNRIATLLLYLSTVPFGGGTAFTKLKTYVRPDKGDAVFWYNLKRSGIGDNSTFHAACPVLAGVKWVANKWFHAHGQEFRRPCLLNDDS